MKQINSFRDVIIMQDGDNYLVSAVDSCGSIGKKKNDALYCPLDIAGLYTARVALLEIIATGAKPAFATITVCNEPETAEELLDGIKKAFSNFSGLPWIISTEKNMPTSMTAFGVSVTGVCEPSALRIGKCLSGDVLCCMGLPLSGAETLAPDAQMFEVSQMNLLMENPLVGSLIPVGSKGIAFEIEILAKESGLHAEINNECGIDLYKSAGPSSCVVFSARPQIKSSSKLPFRIVGSLK